MYAICFPIDPWVNPTKHPPYVLDISVQVFTLMIP